jgi:predicted nucleic acid-binding protein
MAYPLVVVDASAAAALLLAEDKGEDVAELIRDTVAINGQIFVPGLFWFELGNTLVTAERAERLTAQSSSAALREFARLPVVTRQQSDFTAAGRILTLSRENGLTYYDASYLELALRFQAPLKSYDTHLIALRDRFPLIL